MLEKTCANCLNHYDDFGGNTLRCFIEPPDSNTHFKNYGCGEWKANPMKIAEEVYQEAEGPCDKPNDTLEDRRYIMAQRNAYVRGWLDHEKVLSAGDLTKEIVHQTCELAKTGLEIFTDEAKVFAEVLKKLGPVAEELEKKKR